MPHRSINELSRFIGLKWQEQDIESFIIIMKRDIKGLSYNELDKVIIKEGFPSYRAKQIYDWLYLKKVNTFRQMSNLPLDLIHYLESTFNFASLGCIKQNRSKDGTTKYLFQLSDKYLIESVLIRGKRRNTVCLSSQVGCLWHCLFCVSGKKGFQRNLKAEEIVEQLISVQRTSGEQINNIVYMGMGEPFNNFEQLIKSINIINDPKGINIGARKITISTCGIIPGINRLALNPLQIELSVSLHSAEDWIRDYLMPVNKKYPLKKLIAACKKYTEKKNRQVTFEYLMLKGINDSREQARKLSRLISGFKSKVNLIIYNPVSFYTKLLPSEEDAVLAFQQVLQNNHIPVTTRHSKGQDIQAACGQLRSNYLRFQGNSVKQ